MRIIRRITFVFAALSICIILAGCFLVASDWLSDDEQEVGVAREWSDTIARLGIEPVYPPEEDIVVGDIYAILTSDALVVGNGTPLLGRSVKLTRLDLTKELTEFYKATYIFPETMQSPALPSDVWRQKPSDLSLFKNDEERRYLPLVLLPGITISRTRSAAASSGGAIKKIRSAVGFGNDDRENIEIRIPSVESYGLPSLISTGKLFQFCSDPRTRRACTQTGARGQLSMIVRKQIFDKMSDYTYRYGVEIVLMTRVFLTRTVITSTSSQRGSYMQASVAAEIASQATAMRDLSAAVASAQTSSGDQAQSSAAARLLDEQQKRLQSLAHEMNFGASASTSRSRQVTVSQTLQRPVVIGFRGVRTTLFSDD